VRIEIDRSRCARHGQCEITAPQIFHVDDETDSLVVLVPEPDESVRELVEDAASACPTQAITVVES
jgi:ferredoxin